uniref:Sodium/potassium-transporting ATPase subunit beta n=1 Tax=Ciona intestinalis TaxID=7719 RepID=F6ST26_CIOIN
AMGKKKEEKNLRGFMRFLYNKEEKSILGRNSASWGRILIFYMFYYAFLAALFAISMTIVLGTLDPDVPRFQTRLQAPGISVQPKLNTKTERTSEIIFKQSDAGSYQKYVDTLTDFLAPYSKAKQVDLTDCPLNGSVKMNQAYSKDSPPPVCKFDIDNLGPCKQPPYGYDKGQPCILVKVNRAVGNADSNAPPLKDVLMARNRPYNPKRLYISCYDATSGNQTNLNTAAGVSANTVYYPEDNGMPFTYYPYYGLNLQPEYRSPLVAVQFMNVKRNVEVRVRCKAYALNIVDSKRMSTGYFTFTLQVNE